MENICLFYKETCAFISLFSHTLFKTTKVDYNVSINTINGQLILFQKKIFSREGSQHLPCTLPNVYDFKSWRLMWAQFFGFFTLRTWLRFINSTIYNLSFDSHSKIISNWNLVTLMQKSDVFIRVICTLVAPIWLQPYSSHTYFIFTWW